jgi:hypothetical protein
MYRSSFHVEIFDHLWVRRDGEYPTFEEAVAAAGRIWETENILARVVKDITITRKIVLGTFSPVKSERSELQFGK